MEDVTPPGSVVRVVSDPKPVIVTSAPPADIAEQASAPVALDSVVLIAPNGELKKLTVTNAGTVRGVALPAQ